jgi:hypothetical protein
MESLKTYWDILKEEISAPSGLLMMVFPVVAFLPFAIAALFVRSPKSLYCQWIGLGVVLLLPICLSFVVPGTPQDPEWCFQPDQSDSVELGIVFMSLAVLFMFSVPIFIFMTMIGLSLPAKDGP